MRTTDVANTSAEKAFDLKVPFTPSNVRAGDLNEDGVPDLITSDQYSNEVGVILSNP